MKCGGRWQRIHVQTSPIVEAINENGEPPFPHMMDMNDPFTKAQVSRLHADFNSSVPTTPSKLDRDLRDYHVEHTRDQGSAWALAGQEEKHRVPHGNSYKRVHFSTASSSATTAKEELVTLLNERAKCSYVMPMDMSKENCLKFIEQAHEEEKKDRMIEMSLNKNLEGDMDFDTS